MARECHNNFGFVMVVFRYGLNSAFKKETIHYFLCELVSSPTSPSSSHHYLHIATPLELT